MTEGYIFSLSTLWGGGVQGGYPVSGPGGYPISGGGVPAVAPPPGIASTCYYYAAGGMPVAFTQEDFLVFAFYWRNVFIFSSVLL